MKEIEKVIYTISKYRVSTRVNPHPAQHRNSPSDDPVPINELIPAAVEDMRQMIFGADDRVCVSSSPEHSHTIPHENGANGEFLYSNVGARFHERRPKAHKHSRLKGLNCAHVS